MNINRETIIGVVIIVGSVFFSSFLFYAYQIIYTPNILVGKPDQYFYINDEDNFKDLQNRLVNEYIVNDLISFSFLAKLMKYDKNIKAGQYLIKSNMSNTQAIHLLRSGEQHPVKVTFNNIRTKADLAGKITWGIYLDSVSFFNTLKDTTITAKYGFEPENLIGMFIPNTYELYWNISGEGLLNRMKYEYDKFWTRDRLKKADSLGLTQKEVSTLASIVQAESNKIDERSRIAGVYLNRLSRNMKLQADPTIIFALGDFSIRRILDDDKDIDSHYNTYKYKGLPPGPINLPEMVSLDAVLNAERHKYLYFCAKEDFSGYHVFATNLRKHNINARKYRTALNKMRLYR